MSRRFNGQYITFLVVLGELPESPPDAQFEAASEVHDAAYKIVDAGWRHLPSCVVCEQETEVETFELCRDDGEVHEVEPADSKLAWSIGFYAGRNLSRTQVCEIRDLVISAYQKAAEGSGLSVRFVGAERQNEFTVSEDSTVDFNAEPPPAV